MQINKVTLPSPKQMVNYISRRSDFDGKILKENSWYFSPKRVRKRNRSEKVAQFRKEGTLGSQ